MVKVGMNSFLFGFVAYVSVVLTSIASVGEVHAAGVKDAVDTKPIVVGIFPRRNPKDTLQRFSPLVKYLEETLQHPFSLVLSKDYESFSQKLYSGSFDLVHLNQYHYIKLHEELGYEAIAQNEEFGEKTIQAAIYAKVGSGIDDLHDLRGKKISFGGSKQAIISYMIPTVMLYEAGLLRGHDYEEVIVKNPPNALLNNYLNIVDASGAGDKVLDLPLVKKMINTSQMKVLALSEEYPHLPWAIKAEIDPVIKDKIRTAMLQLGDTEEGREVLNTAVLTGFNSISDSDYDSLRKVVKKLKEFDN